jgi:hypothetical protein
MVLLLVILFIQLQLLLCWQRGCLLASNLSVFSAVIVIFNVVPRYLMNIVLSAVVSRMELLLGPSCCCYARDEQQQRTCHHPSRAAT